ncbi:MAG: acylneuraminate cytidylyltransferase family protein [Rhodospirillales bacterium]|nr:acylneuraminate cytidylyltransferase family protein [Rhodospirillales bacterium]
MTFLLPKAVAVIPARGGSKRLPRKNVLPFRGKPMLAYTIEAALSCGRLQRVVVSTDDDEIAEIGRCAGAEIDRRPAELASDGATINQVLSEYLNRRAAAGEHWDIICCLYATCPLRNADDIAAVLDLLQPGECDFALAVYQLDDYTHQAMRRHDDGGLDPLWPEMMTRRASDIGPLYRGNGSTYAASVPAFLRNGSFYGLKMRGYVMPRERSIDLDTVEDLKLLEFHCRRDGL